MLASTYCLAATRTGGKFACRIDSDHSRLGLAPQTWSGHLDISPHGRLYFGWRRLIDRDSAHQLFPGNHVTSSVSRWIGFRSIGAVAQVQPEEELRKQQFADKKRAHIDRSQGKHGTAGQQRKERFRNLVEPGRPAVGARPSRRFTKLDSKSPAMAVVATNSPIPNPRPITGAPNVVTNSEATTPRMVLEGPNSGRPSTNWVLPSSGVAQVSPRILLAITGEPFASESRSSSCATVI